MSSATTTSLRRGVALSLTLVAGASSLLLAGPAQAAEHPSLPVASTVSAADAERASTAVAAEDRRLTEIRTVSSVARWQGKNWQTPYRLSTSTGYTLVLTPSQTPYTVTDLLRLAPQTFLRMSDGAYLLTEHIAIMPRATLRLNQPGGMTLRLASSIKGFATIVSLGGKLELVGEQGARLEVSSWDLDAAAPDTTGSDGRAYIRAIGGQLNASYVDLSNLGFWSGRTGGLALTGTDRPNTGSISPAAGKATPTAGTPSALTDAGVAPAGQLQPGQAIPQVGFSMPLQDYVSSRIANCTIVSDAFGLFVSGANGVQIADTTVSKSSITGVVMHRFVSNGIINRTVSSQNVGDGFTLDRAATGVTITESSASYNSGNGFTLSGQALAEGPSITGSSLKTYGNNSITGSTSANNGRYGIRVVGGFNIGVQNNRVHDNDMGIVVTGPASRISVTGNDVGSTNRHGIALVDGVENTTVTGNVVDGAMTGIYLRGSSAEIKGNTVQNARSHAVSLVGEVRGTDVAFNVLAGTGASALDTMRGKGHVTSSGNRLDGWHDTTPWYFWFKKLLHPMTALWVAIAVLASLSAFRSRRRDSAIVHPYAHQMAHQGVPTLPEALVIDLTGSGATAVGVA